MFDLCPLSFKLHSIMSFVLSRNKIFSSLLFYYEFVLHNRNCKYDAVKRDWDGIISNIVSIIIM